VPLAEEAAFSPDTAKRLASLIQKRQALDAELKSNQTAALLDLRQRVEELPDQEPVYHAIRAACGAIQELEKRRKLLKAQAVELPAGAEANQDYADALTRLLAGKSPFMLPFGKGEARELVLNTRVLGLAPTEPTAWAHVQEMCDWRREAAKQLARWNALTAQLEAQPLAGVGEPAFLLLNEAQLMVTRVHVLASHYNVEMPKLVTEVFGQRVTGRLQQEGPALLAHLASSLEAHFDRDRLAQAEKSVHALASSLVDKRGAIADKMAVFLRETVGSPGADEIAMQAQWQSLLAEMGRLQSMQGSLQDVEQVTAQLDSCGAPRWAERLRTMPALNALDPHTPPDWQSAWAWRQAVTLLDQIDGHAHLRQMFQQRWELTQQLSRTYQDLVAQKTWLGVHHNSPDNIRQALQAYLTAVQAMGAGTGIRAIRHRKTARLAMVRAYQAVPCWVLPQWRVSETLPAELGLFDLVVVDEASQSDISALPAILRGKKLLVVGDHKQVSPSAVGLAEQRVLELEQRFLKDQPHGRNMTPEQSIYDLARVIFAGNSVMLREHFRCVPAIIEYSNREWYEGGISPLRLPRANERLDPPLVDVFVKGGHRKGDVNLPEAQAIVDEIKAILADEQFAGKSIGVVTLLGTSQAARIHELVSEQISGADVVARKIAVGPPPVFQGRERDIMLISMVLGPGDRAAANKADMQQRFNVALSRARDRMYLFRSVDLSHFKEDTLNARVIQHFSQPFRTDVEKVTVLRERCESGFERDMFDELVTRGYRVQPQVRCGAYRLDFVVEGSEGRRLAVECDGDQYHGPGQWASDMTRQRVLERAGWTFWRCFASSFARRREEVIGDLIETLNGLNIEPLGSEAVDNTKWTHYKEVDPMGVATKEEDAEVSA